MPLFWRSLLVMCWIKCFYGQKIDNLHQTCSAPEDMDFLKNELSILRGKFQEQEKNMEILKNELNVFKKIVKEVSEIKGTIQHLTLKQTMMEGKNNETDEDVSEIKETIQQLTSKHTTMGRRINETDEGVSEIKVTIQQLSSKQTPMGRRINQTDEDVSEIKETIQQLSSKQTTMGRRIDQVEESVMELKRSTQQIKSSQATMKGKMNQEVAFTAELKYKSPIYALKENEKIVFSHIVTNRGNAYNKDTGKFRCPRSGLYAFFFNIVTTKNTWALVEITKNGVFHYALAYAEGDANGGTNGSAFVLLPLTVGEEIWLRASNDWTSAGEILKHTQNTFSGFLVHPY